jgi:hypothetical protein
VFTCSLEDPSPSSSASGLACQLVVFVRAR